MRILILIYFFAFLFSSTAQSQTLQSKFWSPNGPVNTSVLSPSGDTLYIGGHFSFIGPYTGGGAVIDAVRTDTADLLWPKVIGEINAVVPDGSGGWFIGGYFSHVDTTPRRNLAHIKSDKTLDINFDPNVDDHVYSLVLKDSLLFVGGIFDTVNIKIQRNSLVAFNIKNGIVTDWNPGIGGMFHDIRAMTIVDSNLYFGGTFNNVKGEPRGNIAAVNIHSAIPLDWPLVENGTRNLGGRVNAMLAVDSTIYVGGYFSDFNKDNIQRHWIGAFNLNGSLNSWKPDLDNSVNSFAFKDSILFIAGAFNWVDKQQQKYLAAFNINTGLKTDWKPSVEIRSGQIAVRDTLIYVVGDGATSFALNSGELISSWRPRTNDVVWAIAIKDSSIYLGGKFTYVGGVARGCLASIDLKTGRITDWNPNIYYGGGSIYTLVLRDSTVFVGGSFLHVNGESVERYGIAAFDNKFGKVTSWDPQPYNNFYYSNNSIVRSLAIYGNNLYVGGDFNRHHDTSLPMYLTAYDLETAKLTWLPKLNNPVNSLVVRDSILYIGGAFTKINNTLERNYLAAFNLSTNSPTSWNPNVNKLVATLATISNRIYAGGEFTTVNGDLVNRNYLAAFDPVYGYSLLWNPNVNKPVYNLSKSNSTLYAGGAFTKAGDVERNFAAAFNINDGEATDWNPKVNAPIRTFTFNLDKEITYVGGDFKEVLNQPFNFYLAALSVPLDSIPSDIRTEDEKSAEIYSFPNPASNFITVNLEDYEGTNCTIEIYSAMGIKVLSENINLPSKYKALNISHLATGSYNMRIISAKSQQIRSFNIVR